jgi:hypothetical protein
MELLNPVTHGPPDLLGDADADLIADREERRALRFREQDQELVRELWHIEAYVITPQPPCALPIPGLLALAPIGATLIIERLFERLAHVVT